jgi:DNA invertase Pin-like site-specific DNA recombinase
MLTLNQIIDSCKKPQQKMDDQELRKLPFKDAFIYGRVSTPGQIRDSKESIREIARLVELAIEDGYQTKLVISQVEEWLDSISKGIVLKGVLADGQVTVDVQDLGISGQLTAEDRRGMASLQTGIASGRIGAVYVTEGVSRLSRDRDHILPFQLLKLLKEQKIRLRTPEGVWNPAIERDWDYLADEFDQAIGELKTMNKRMYRRKAQKAARGEFVGEPVPPGFILPVTGRKSNGQYEYGKLDPYLPHAEIVQRILEKYVLQGGSEIKTKAALKDLVFPNFPPNLNYMERLSSLRSCHKNISGYEITPALIHNMALNIKLIGIWSWGNHEPIVGNHKPIISEEIFLQAYNLAASKLKRKGKAVYFEPMEWSGLLWCNNHLEPRQISSHNAEGRYVCDRDYHLGAGSICLDIEGEFLNEPLLSTTIKHLDFEPLIEEVLVKLDNEAKNGRLEFVMRSQKKARLEQEKLKWESLLPCCVNTETGVVDKGKESFYWVQIRETEKRLAELKAEPVSLPAKNPTNFAKVKELLKGLNKNWKNYSVASRNRLLKLFIDRVEIKGTYEINAKIIWKTGFEQNVVIHRPPAKSQRERRWTDPEDNLLMKLFSSSTQKTICDNLPNRSWSAITLRAMRLKIRRERQYHPPKDWRPWSSMEDSYLKLNYESGISLKEIASELKRSLDAIENRSALMKLSRPHSVRWKKNIIRWESHDLIPLHGLSSER